MSRDLGRRLAAEGVGSFFLFAAVIGSGIMAEALSGGNVGQALLANTLATGAMLFVLITMLGPISGAHLNPAVTLVMASRRDLPWRDAGLYVVIQLAGGLLGAWAAHLTFDLPILQASVKARHRPVDRRGNRDLWPDPHHRRHAKTPPRMGPSFSRPLHHLGLLVHIIDQLRQPGDYHRPQPKRQLRRHCSPRCTDVHYRAASRGVRRRCPRPLAVPRLVAILFEIVSKK
jgi:hypothetical protein